MDPNAWYSDKWSPETGAWIAALIIVIMEFRYIRQLLVFAVMKLYEFFIQRDAEKN